MLLTSCARRCPDDKLRSIKEKPGVLAHRMSLHSFRVATIMDLLSQGVPLSGPAPRKRSR